jgi:hypothetical protein
VEATALRISSLLELGKRSVVWTRRSMRRFSAAGNTECGRAGRRSAGGWVPEPVVTGGCRPAPLVWNCCCRFNRLSK